MLENISEFNDYTIAASDGTIGKVSDFLFDDASWSLRWLVLDTGNWLSGRKVLLPLSVLGHPDPTLRQFAVRLTMKEVEDSPSISTDRPVSRQMETNLYDYYGWTPVLGALLRRIWLLWWPLGGHDTSGDYTKGTATCRRAKRS